MARFSFNFMKSKIILFSSPFNPITLGHEFIISEICNILENKDKLIIGIDSTHANKNNLSDIVHRELMVANFVAKNVDSQKREKIEILRLSSPYSYECLDLLHKLYGDESFEYYFVVGEDNFNNMHMFKEVDRILNNNKLIVFSRSNNSSMTNKEMDVGYIFKTGTPLTSSSQARSLIEMYYKDQSESISRDILSEINSDTFDYIVSNNLYASS